VLRLAELAARECDGKDAFWVPVLIAAKRQRRPEIKMREIGSSVGTCRRLRLDDGLLFPYPVKEGLPKITGQFSESRSATPPPDVFWRVRSCILFQLDFPLPVEKSRFRDHAGGEAIFEPSRTRTAESFGCRTDADVENEPVGIPDGETSGHH
jgi:hypothetical protein